MTWKSYAAVSGATVVAGWLVSTPPPSNAPTGAAAVSTQALPTPPAPSDIERQAMRLQARLRAERAYAEPARNPFRFGSRDTIAAAPARPADASAPPAEPVEVAPAAPVMSLSGIAEDLVDGRVERTAVVSSPAGVFLVLEGQEILGQYRVLHIESEAVELVGLSDGVSRRLTLGR